MTDSVSGERALLARACAHVGLDEALAARAELLSYGENAVFALPGVEIVARVGRGPHLTERAHREIRVARWLAEQDFPAVRPAGVATEAIEVSGRPVTFWERLPAPDRGPTVRDLAGLLRALHALPAPEFTLPPREPLALVETWLDSADAAVSLEDRRFLLRRRDELLGAYTALEPMLPPGVIHGDALLRNVGVHGGRALLLDLETFAYDLRELDLALTPLAAVRYGLPPSAPAEFAEEYGVDVTAWEGYPVVRDVRELAATAWVAQHVPGKPAAHDEFTHRVRCLREGDLDAAWHSW